MLEIETLARRVIYEVRYHEGGWAIFHRGEAVARFQRRERATRFANLIAQREFQRNGTSSAVRVEEDGLIVDVILHGDKDPTANALAWIRHVKALRNNREKQKGRESQDVSGHDSDDSDVLRSA